MVGVTQAHQLEVARALKITKHLDRYFHDVLGL
jgi:hypothetical protein